MVIVITTAPEPLLQTLKVDIAGGAHAQARRYKWIINAAWAPFLRRVPNLRLISQIILLVVTKADTACFFLVMLLQSLHTRTHTTKNYLLALLCHIKVGFPPDSSLVIVSHGTRPRLELLFLAISSENTHCTIVFGRP